VSSGVVRGSRVLSAANIHYEIGWDADGVRFYFGHDAYPNLKTKAEELDSKQAPKLRRNVSAR
jgi:hypothetical protein